MPPVSEVDHEKSLCSPFPFVGRGVRGGFFAEFRCEFVPQRQSLKYAADGDPECDLAASLAWSPIHTP